MINNEFKEYVDNQNIMDLYSTYLRVNKKLYPDNYQYVKKKIRESTNEELENIPDYSKVSKNELEKEFNSSEILNSPIRKNLIEKALNKAKEDEVILVKNQNYEYDGESIYTERTVSTATFLGGPIAAGLMIANNYKVFGRIDLAFISIFLGFVSTFLLVVFLNFGPTEIIEKIPNQILPIIYTLIVYVIIKTTQDEEIKEYLDSGGKKASIPKVIGISLLSLLLLVLIFFGVASFSAPYEGEMMHFGDTNNEIIYDSELNEEHIKTMGKVLMQIGYFHDRFQTIIQVRKESENVYHVYLPSDKNMWEDEKYIWTMKNLSDIFNEFLPNVEFKITLLYETILTTEEKNLI